MRSFDLTFLRSAVECIGGDYLISLGRNPRPMRDPATGRTPSRRAPGGRHGGGLLALRQEPAGRGIPQWRTGRGCDIFKFNFATGLRGRVVQWSATDSGRTFYILSGGFLPGCVADPATPGAGRTCVINELAP